MRNVPIRWTHHSVWNSDNRTEEDSAWNDPPGFQVREAIVALPDSFTRSVGLPSAQRWPWDESKGVYFLEGLHNLHCVVSVISLMLIQSKINKLKPERQTQDSTTNAGGRSTFGKPCSNFTRGGRLASP